MTFTSLLAPAFCFLAVVFIATTSARDTTRRPPATTVPPAICPTNTNSFKPCGCTPLNSLRGVELNCRSRGLDDVKIIQVLNNFKPKKGSPLISFNAFNNSLTKVPAEISKFPSLLTIYLSYNQIKSLPSNAFNLPDVKNIRINLSTNEIDSVASGAFNFPSPTDMTVDLANNSLTSFSASAFKGNGAAIELFLGKNGLTSSSVDKTLKDCTNCNIIWMDA